MRVQVSTFVGAAFALGAGCILSEAFIQPSPAGLVPAAAVAVPAKHSGSTALRVLRRPSGAQAAPAAGRSRKPGLRPSARGAGPAGVGGEEPRTGKAKQRATGSGGGGGGGGGNRLVRRLSPPAAAVSQLQHAAATTLAAVILVASSSTEQDIMTAMMGLDPSIANVGAQQQQQQQPSSMALSKEDQVAPNLGSIDVTGQSSGAGEIPGGVGGGFREGRLMIDQDSDLAMMLGKKMKNPDAEPRTH